MAGRRGRILAAVLLMACAAFLGVALHRWFPRRSGGPDGDPAAREALRRRSPPAVAGDPPPRAAAPTGAEEAPGGKVLEQGVVRGSVVTPERIPLMGARVALLPEVELLRLSLIGSPDPDAMESRATQVVETGEGGQFTLSCRPGSSHAVRVRAPGFQTGVLRGIRAGDEVHVILEPGATIRGCIRGASGSDSVLVAATRSESESVLPPNLPLVSCRVQGDGTYCLAGIPTGAFLVSATLQSTGVRVAAEIQVRGGETLEINLRLPESLLFEGRAVDAESGEGIAGCRIDSGFGGAVASGPDGSFRIGLPANDPPNWATCALRADHPAYAPAEFAALRSEVAGGASQPRTLRLERMALVHGRVVSGTGGGRPDLTGCLVSTVSRSPGGGVVERTGTCDAGGAFRVHASTAAGSHVDVRVLAPGFGRGSACLEPPPAAKDVDAGEIRLRREVSFRVETCDADTGAPVPWAFLQVLDFGSCGQAPDPEGLGREWEAPVSAASLARTDSEGIASIRDCVGPTVVVRACARGFATVTSRAAIREGETVRLRLQKYRGESAIVRGLAVDSFGFGVAANLEVEDTERGTATTVASRSSGAFWFLGRRGGVYRIRPADSPASPWVVTEPVGVDSLVRLTIGE